MRAILKAAAVATGLAAAAIAAAPAQAAALDHGYHDSGVSFSITFGSGHDSRYHHRYSHSDHHHYGPRKDYWGRYPSYGYGYSPFPGYDYLRRKHAYYGSACYWRVDVERYRHRYATVKSLLCYDRYGHGYVVPGSKQVIRYHRGRPHGYGYGAYH